MTGAKMKVRSMTGFAQVAATPADATLPAFTLTLKSVNHRFLDLHLRLPSDADELELKLRRALKEKLARGHVEVTISVSATANTTVLFNKEIVGGYVEAFRQASDTFGVGGEVDLNVALKMPGALSSGASGMSEALQSAILAQLDTAVAKLNAMREHEGNAIARELRERITRLERAVDEIGGVRDQVMRAVHDRMHARLSELLGDTKISDDRILQEAAMIAERSDVQEEIARLRSHITHFLSLLDQGGEVGKKLDFLLQEFNREANTLLSKTSGISGEGIRITDAGISMKSEIEKLREQVQNLE